MERNQAGGVTTNSGHLTATETGTPMMLPPSPEYEEEKIEEPGQRRMGRMGGSASPEPRSRESSVDTSTLVDGGHVYTFKLGVYLREGTPSDTGSDTFGAKSTAAAFPIITSTAATSAGIDQSTLQSGGPGVELLTAPNRVTVTQALFTAAIKHRPRRHKRHLNKARIHRVPLGGPILEDDEEPELADLEPMKPVTVISVFRGHGNGDRCINHISQTLNELITSSPDFTETTKVSDCISRAYLQSEVSFVREAPAEDRSGSSCTTVVISGDEVVVGNVGNCAAILHTNDGKFIEVTVSHDLGNAGERRRVERLNCPIVRDRINGELETTRSFGDVDLKIKFPKVVLATPDTVHFQILINPSTSSSTTSHLHGGAASPGNTLDGKHANDLYLADSKRRTSSKSSSGSTGGFLARMFLRRHSTTSKRWKQQLPTFLILATPEFWDQVTPGDAVKIANKVFQQDGSANEAAQRLMQKAEKNAARSVDITVVVVLWE